MGGLFHAEAPLWFNTFAWGTYLLEECVTNTCTSKAAFGSSWHSTAESCDGTRIQDAVSCADVHLYRDEGLLSPSFILRAQRFQVGDAKDSDWHWLDIAQLQNGVSRLH